MGTITESRSSIYDIVVPMQQIAKPGHMQTHCSALIIIITNWSLNLKI